MAIGFVLIMNDIVFVKKNDRDTRHTVKSQTTSSKDYLSQFKNVAKANTTLFLLPGLRHLEINVSRRE